MRYCPAFVQILMFRTNFETKLHGKARACFKLHREASVQQMIVLYSHFQRFGFLYDLLSFFYIFSNF